MFRKLIWLKLRLVMGLIFLWAFVDKLLGLGFATEKGNAWINGGSPTTGYLLNATSGPFEDFFKGLSGLGVGGINIIDWVFMLGLLFVGLTLVFNKFLLWGSLAGSIMLFLMWISAFPPENNPLLDDHVVYILVLIILAQKNKDRL